MDNQQQLYDALKAADAAGDTAGAQRLAAYIQSQQAPPAAPTPPAPEAPKEPLGQRIMSALAMGDTEGAMGKPAPLKELGETANAIPQGINSSVADLAGMPMDAATNVSNLLKAGAGYVVSKFNKDGSVPDMLQADDPASIVGTSEHIKNKIRGAGAGNLIDAAPDNIAAQGVHGASEMVGVAPVAGLAGEAGSSLAAANDLKKLGATEPSGAPRPQEATNLELLRSAGYKIRPTDVQVANPGDPSLKPTLFEKAAQGAAGASDLAKQFRLHNQPITTGLIAEDIGLPRSTTKIGPEELRTAKAVPAATYSRVGGEVGTFKPSESLEPQLQDYLTSDNKSETGEVAAKKLLRDIESGKSLSGPEIIERISDLRGRIGGRNVASILEDEVSRQLQARKSDTTLGDFQQARTQFAKIYQAQKARTTGDQIDASKYGRVYEKYPDLLTGNARVVAVAANEGKASIVPPKGETNSHGVAEFLGDLAHTVTGARYLGRKIVGSDSFQNKYGAVANPTEQSYFSGLGTKEPQSPAFRPPQPPAPQIEYKPGEAPIAQPQQVDAGAARAPVNNPAELQQVLGQAAEAAKANPAPAPQPQVAPGGLPALPAPGGLAPRGVQPNPIDVAPNGGPARTNDATWPYQPPEVTENNPSRARMATMATMLAKSERELPVNVGRQAQEAQARWLTQELKARGADRLPESEQKKLIIQLLRNP